MAKWTNHSVLVALQAAFGTVHPTDADFSALYLSEAPTWAPEIETTELDGLSGQVGAAAEVVAGRRKGTLTIKGYCDAFKQAYDPTAEQPGGTPVGSVEVVPAWFCLIGSALGSYGSGAATTADWRRGLHLSCSAYTSAGVASATSTAITTDNATASDKIAVGQLCIAASSGTDTTPQFGFVKTKAGQVCTLFEASRNTKNSATANMYGTATAFTSTSQYTPKSFTFRLTGPETAQAIVVQDCTIERWTVTWDSGNVMTYEIQMRAYDYWHDKTKGGLVVPAAYERVPRFVGTANGRATIGGTATCGLRSCTVTWQAELREDTCHGAQQGIESVTVRRSTIEASFGLAYDSGDAVYDDAGSAGNVGQHKWRSLLERGARTSVGAYVGSTVGRIAAFLLPSVVVTGAQFGDQEGAWGDTVTVRAASYSGDTTDTSETTANSPINSVFRVAIG